MRTIALSLRPLTLNRPFAARLVKHRSDDSFLEGIPVRRMAGFGRLQPVAWKIGCTSALDPEAAVGELPH